MHEVGQWNKNSVQLRKTQVKLSQVPERNRRCQQYMLHDIFLWCFLVRLIHFGKSAHEKVQETHDKNMNNAKQCKENINNATEIHKKCKWHVINPRGHFKARPIHWQMRDPDARVTWAPQSLNNAKSLLWQFELDPWILWCQKHGYNWSPADDLAIVDLNSVWKTY